jgi:hypothetical protein
VKQHVGAAAVAHDAAGAGHRQASRPAIEACRVRTGDGRTDADLFAQQAGLRGLIERPAEAGGAAVVTLEGCADSGSCAALERLLETAVRLSPRIVVDPRPPGLCQQPRLGLARGTRGAPARQRRFGPLRHAPRDVRRLQDAGLRTGGARRPEPCRRARTARRDNGTALSAALQRACPASAGSRGCLQLPVPRSRAQSGTRGRVGIAAVARRSRRPRGPRDARGVVRRSRHRQRPPAWKRRCRSSSPAGRGTCSSISPAASSS